MWTAGTSPAMTKKGLHANAQEFFEKDTSPAVSPRTQSAQGFLAAPWGKHCPARRGREGSPPSDEGPAAASMDDGRPFRSNRDRLSR